MTTHAQHTPGPWKYDQQGRIFAEDTRWAPTQFIATMDTGWDVAESLANARLISLAPDLLAALREHDRLLKEYVMGRAPHGSVSLAARQTVSRLLARVDGAA